MLKRSLGSGFIHCWSVQIPFIPFGRMFFDFTESLDSSHPEMSLFRSGKKPFFLLLSKLPRQSFSSELELSNPTSTSGYSPISLEMAGVPYQPGPNTCTSLIQI